MQLTLEKTTSIGVAVKAASWRRGCGLLLFKLFRKSHHLNKVSRGQSPVVILFVSGRPRRSGPGVSAAPHTGSYDSSGSPLRESWWTAAILLTGEHRTDDRQLSCTNISCLSIRIARPQHWSSYIHLIHSWKNFRMPVAFLEETVKKNLNFVRRRNRD
jgi:hypothetical protein